MTLPCSPVAREVALQCPSRYRPRTEGRQDDFDDGLSGNPATSRSRDRKRPPCVAEPDSGAPRPRQRVLSLGPALILESTPDRRSRPQSSGHNCGDLTDHRQEQEPSWLPPPAPAGRRTS